MRDLTGLDAPTPPPGTMLPGHKNLAEKLPVACRNTVLSASDMTFSSFELKFGFGFMLSAADAVHALVGLLSRHCLIGGTNAGGAGAGGSSRNGGRERSGPMEPEEVREEQAEAAKGDFW
jgi:hypothetical protein